jgi:hypothetical protein
MKRAYLDSETCGFVGMPVLLQYAFDDGPIHLHEVWKQPVRETFDLLMDLAESDFVGFNLTFDAFHLCKLATMWSLLPPTLIPEDDIPLVASVERQAIWGNCWKPHRACDLMLHTRKGKYQTLMPRKPIMIRRVPKAISEQVVKALGETLHFNKIFFAKTKTNPGQWSILPIEDQPNLVNLKLSFNPAAGLKFLAEYALGYTPKYHFEDVELGAEHFPSELGFAPFHDCAPEPERAWPHVIKAHIEHWHSNEPARAYAKDDIVITRDLDNHLGNPEAGDDDSELACMVAACRWRGFEVNIPGIKALRVKAQETLANSPININAPAQVRKYMCDVLDDVEKMAIEASGCTKPVLESIVASKEWNHNPAAKARAAELLGIKKASKEEELYGKLLIAGRLHPDLNVIGAKSGRMSGGGGLNVQGIKNTKPVRRCFPLRDTGHTLPRNPMTKLSLGDFSSFEVTIADAIFNDPQLRKDLETDRSIHAEFGSLLYDLSYDEVYATKGTDRDLYTDAKSAFFATVLYLGDAGTINRKQGIPLEKAEEAIHKIGLRYKKLGEARQESIQKFSAMSQAGGLGTAIEWKDPVPYAETIFGFRRDFTLEWQICKGLYDLAQNPPPEWKKVPDRLVRSNRMQSAGGAAQSALYGAAFGLQGSNLRAGANHKIQGSGAQITKRVQRRVWDLQPCGFHPFRLTTLQVHDELLTPHAAGMTTLIRLRIQETVAEFKPAVPLIRIDWLEVGNSWADK